MRLGQINTSFTVPTSFQNAVTTSGRATELAAVVNRITARLRDISTITESRDFKAATQARRESFLASMTNIRGGLERLASMLPSASVTDGLIALQSADRSLETALQAARTIASEGAARRRASSSNTPPPPSPEDVAPTGEGMSTAMKVALAAGAGLLAFGAIYYFTKDDGTESFAALPSRRTVSLSSLEGMGRCKNVMVRGKRRRMCWGEDGKLASNQAA